jgi:predicted phosphate transport protein (TIGR00153 family)
VRFRIRPVETTFYDLFSESASHLVAGSDLLASILGDGVDRSEVAAQMREAEHQADETTHRIVRLVNSTFVTPFDREDIYSLASALDDVMDFMEEAVDLIVLYGVDELPPYFADQLDVLQRASRITAESMPRLRTMKDLDEYWIEVNRLENEGDRNHRRILAHLFGGSYKAMQVLKLKDVVESVEQAIDALEKVANIVEQIAVKES